MVRHWSTSIKKVINVDVNELWVNSFIKGRKYSHKPSIFTHGVSYLSTACLLDSDCDLDTAYLPIKTWMQYWSTGRNMGRFIARYCEKFNTIFRSIKKTGFRTTSSLLGVDLEDGQPFLKDGHRRLASLVALGKQRSLDVGVMDYSDPENSFLQGFNRAIKMNLKKSNKLYQPILDFPHFSTEKKREIFSVFFDAVLDCCGNVKNKNILDVGSCLGYFCFGLARHGAYVVGVERDIARFSLCKRLLLILGGFDWSNPKFIPLPIESYIPHTEKHFDYALMLNVLHYGLREDKLKAWQTLNKIAEKSDKIILTVDHIALGVSQDEVGDVILKSSVLNHYEDMGPVFGVRHLYVFWK